MFLSPTGGGPAGPSLHPEPPGPGTGHAAVQGDSSSSPHAESVLLLIPGRRAVGPQLPVFCPGFQQRPWQMSCSSDRGAEASQSPHPLGSPLRRSSKAATYSTNYSLWIAVGHPACQDGGMSSGRELTNHSTDRLMALKAAELRLSQLWPQHHSTAARGTVFSQPRWKLTSISQGLGRRQPVRRPPAGFPAGPWDI